MSSSSRLLSIMNVVGECSFRHVAANDDSSTAANSSSDMDLDDTPQPICSSSESAEVIFNNVPSVFSKKGRRPPHRSDIMQTTRSAELVNDILTASVPSRRESPLWKNKNPLEYPAPPLAPIRAPSLPRINLDNDDDDDASIIPPCWKPIMEGHNSSCSFQSSFSSVFDASQDYDFPLARPIRTLSPLVSLAGSSAMRPETWHLLLHWYLLVGALLVSVPSGSYLTQWKNYKCSIKPP